MALKVLITALIMLVVSFLLSVAATFIEDKEVRKKSKGFWTSVCVGSILTAFCSLIWVIGE